jgi:hypothetical protein
MFTCVLCTNGFPDESRTEEHVFPEAIGGTLVFFDLCKDCNDHLGHTADAALADHFLIQLVRMRLGLTGKTGHLPNPLRTGKADDGLLFRREVGGDVHQQPRVEHLEGDDVRISVAETDHGKLPEMIEKVMERARQRGLEPTSISTPVTTEGPAPPLTFKPQVDLEHYKSGLLKIAYEIAYLALGPNYIVDATAENLRSLLRLDRITAEHPGATSLQCHFGGLLRSLVPMVGEYDRKLIAAAWPNPAGGIQVYVRVLDTFDTLIRAATDTSSYHLGEFGKAWVVDVATGELEEFSAFEILSRWTGPPS